MLETIAERYHYLIIFALMMIGLFITIDADNLIKRLIGLSVFQTSAFLFYIALGKLTGGTAPILIDEAGTIYSNPLPHVLILTAIVVGAASLSVGLALAARIHRAYGCIRTELLDRADCDDTPS